MQAVAMVVPALMLFAGCCAASEPISELVEFRHGQHGYTVELTSPTANLDLRHVLLTNTMSLSEGQLLAPAGYRICTVRMLARYTRLAPGSGFESRLADGARTFAYVTKTTSVMPAAKLQVVLVTDGSETDGCMQDGLLWSCGKFAPSAPYLGCQEIQLGAVTR